MIYSNYLQYYNNLTKRRKRIYRRKWLKSGKQEQAPKTEYSLAADMFNKFTRPSIEENKKQAKLIINNIAIDFMNNIEVKK